MEMDINTDWVNFTHFDLADRPAGHGDQRHRCSPTTRQTSPSRYFAPLSRDFFTMSVRRPAVTAPRPRPDYRGPAGRRAAGLRSGPRAGGPRPGPGRRPTRGGDHDASVSKRLYEAELLRLQAELTTMTEWIRESGARVVVLFEGRDAAGKGGVIKRISEYLSPRICRIVALPAPTERERGQWYFQRYVDQLPSAGEFVLFDRSWYNRAGVEHVMGFCTSTEYHRFLAQCPVFEHLLIDDGIILVKYWFSVSDDEQERRFQSRVNDPLRRWKLSEMDLEARQRWSDYSRAKDTMFLHTDTPESPWYVVDAEDKRRGPDQLHRPPPRPGALPADRRGPPQAAQAGEGRRLPSPAPGPRTPTSPTTAHAPA